MADLRMGNSECEFCAWCTEALDEVAEDDRVSCDCLGLVVCRDCFEGEDGIKQSLNITDSKLFAPFLTGEGCKQVVSGYANCEAVACVECVALKQGIGFTPRKDGRKQGKASGSSGTAGNVSGSDGSDERELWPKWAEKATVLLETIHELGGSRLIWQRAGSGR
mmetsp:Transcript_29343/g.60151  ORF Transcript_29343/g.60151 Transcript_29343/m.60151 type:complete len:164 (+) Transcript_29343:977-1468(+)